MQALAAGGDHTCAILEGGALKCWGRNADGQLGLGDLTNRGDGPGQMGDSLRRGRAGRAGDRRRGRRGAHLRGHRATAASGAGARAPRASSALGNNAGALVPPSSGGRAAGRGDGRRGRRRLLVRAARERPGRLLGRGRARPARHGRRSWTTPRPAAPIGFPAKATALAAGARHACALLEDGRIACWGANDSGQLGLGDEQDRTRPTTVDTARRRVRAVAAGGATTCVLVDGGAVTCWGANDRGQLGLGDAMPRATAGGAGRARHGADARRRSPSAARSRARCSARRDAKCWGDNRAMQLGAPILGPAYGDGPNETGDFLPAAAQGGGRSLRAVVAGRAHACGILDTGDVRCWGDNGSGQLGAGDGDAHSALLHPTGVVDLGASP